MRQHLKQLRELAMYFQLPKNISVKSFLQKILKVLFHFCFLKILTGKTIWKLH